MPRGIVIAPVLNRVVQRAILDTCQSRSERIRKHLGNLPATIATETSVGGLPGKGVPEAIGLISCAIQSGARWFVRSDIKDFFTRIPKDRIRTFLGENIADPAFVELFMAALATELENEADVRDLIHLFPMGNLGVPQGSALSALCANVILTEFDQVLNGRGITTIRYLDDFLILGRDKRSVEKAWAQAVRLLSNLGMEAHDPTRGTGKASWGHIEQGFQFLSFDITETKLAPCRTARQDLLAKLRDIIKEAKRAIDDCEGEIRRAEHRFVQSLDLLDCTIRGWGDAFRATNMRLVFSQLDKDIDELVENYLRWFKRRTMTVSRASRRRMLGIALLSDTPLMGVQEPRLPISDLKPLASDSEHAAIIVPPHGLQGAEKGGPSSPSAALPATTALISALPHSAKGSRILSIRSDPD